MMTTEERLQSIEERVKSQGERLERHSVRLEKLEQTSKNVEEIKAKLSTVEGEIKKMKTHQTITDRKLLAKSNWTIGLLFTIVGLVIYIAFKSPETAKEVVGIVGKNLAQGVSTL